MWKSHDGASIRGLVRFGGGQYAGEISHPRGGAAEVGSYGVGHQDGVFERTHFGAGTHLCDPSTGSGGCWCSGGGACLEGAVCTLRTSHSSTGLVQLQRLNAARAEGGGRDRWEKGNPGVASTWRCEPLEGRRIGLIGGGWLHGCLRRRHHGGCFKTGDGGGGEDGEESMGHIGA